jgi:hypothetical protein
MIINSEKTIRGESVTKKKRFGGAGIWTQDFQHAKQTLYHWVTPPIDNRVLQSALDHELLYLHYFLQIRYRIE